MESSKQPHRRHLRLRRDHLDREPVGARDYEPGHLGDALREQVPEYLLYGLGFLQIVGAWSVIRRVSQWSTGIDHYGMLLSFVALATWATTPFIIDVLTDAVGNSQDLTSAVRLLSGVLLVSMVGYSLLFRHQMRGGYFREGLKPAQFTLARVLSLTVFLWPLAALLLTYVVGAWALVLVLTLSVLTLLPLDAMTSDQYAEAD